MICSVHTLFHSLQVIRLYKKEPGLEWDFLNKSLRRILHYVTGKSPSRWIIHFRRASLPPSVISHASSQLTIISYSMELLSHMTIFFASFICPLSSHQELKYISFTCPKCAGRFCELPTKCRVCGLTLVSSPHLARAYHHLFPVPVFTIIKHKADSSKAEATTTTTTTTTTGENPSSSAQGVEQDEDEKHGLWKDQCFSCRQTLSSGEDLRMSCPECKQVFCIDCDELIHNQLHNCPGCLSIVPDEVVSN